jgi:hypothetical protein
MEHIQKEVCKRRLSGQGRFGSFNQRNCTKPVWKDGWCKVHHPDSEEKRQKISEEKFNKKYENQREKARLIAAAPELLEACKLLQDALTEYKLRDIKKRYSLCVADACASKAIAKAEGKI